MPKKKLEKLNIESVYLFGSQAQKTAGPLSDFDFGIVLESPEEYRDNTMDLYLKLYDIFIDVLPKEYLKRRFEKKEHEVDIVFLQFAPIALQFSVIKNGKVLYQASEEKRLQYEEYVVKKSADLKHFHKISYKALLERI